MKRVPKETDRLNGIVKRAEEKPAEKTPCLQAVEQEEKKKETRKRGGLISSNLRGSSDRKTAKKKLGEFGGTYSLCANNDSHEDERKRSLCNSMRKSLK